MGKWTPEYNDEVLKTKFKSLVAGAISRSGLEKSDPKISYERFVEDLDIGDSFTASVIDCLVKEIADRRSRPEGDRRIIAERTVKSLRSLIAASRVASAERGTRRAHTRRFGLSDFLSSHHDETSQDDDEDEFNAMLEPPQVSLEGARLSSAELFDAYSTGSNSILPFLRQSSPIPISSTEEESAPSFLTRTSPARIVPTSSSSRTVPGSQLSRQASIRRGPRVNRSEFSDFTSRRRTSIRDTIMSRLDEASSSTTRGISHGDGGNASRRRFFPAVTAYHRVEQGLPWNDPDSEGDDARLSVFLRFREDYPEHIQDDAAMSGEHVVPSSPPNPRLRRGSVRAPESMLSRHASPVYPPADDDSGSSTLNPVVEIHRIENNLSNETAAYPTPGPGDDENP